MNNKKLVSISLLSIFLLSYGLTIGLVSASVEAGNATATLCTLHTSNANGVDAVQFGFQQQVTLSWVADGTVDIEIHQVTRTGTVVYSQYSAPSTGSESVVLSPGKYYIVCTGAETEMITVSSFFVLPESAFGALAALGAGFAAIGTVFIVKRKHA